MLEAALEAAARGLYVFPVAPGTKRPMVAAWQQRATQDEATLTEWWGRYPDALVGWVPDRSGLFIMDVDVKEGKDGRHLVEGFELANGELPDTLTIQTRSGGEHRVFKGRVPNSAKDGLDFRGGRGDGEGLGFGIWPNAQSGYAFLRDVKPADAPPALVSFASSRSTKRAAVVAPDKTDVEGFARWLATRELPDPGEINEVGTKWVGMAGDFGVPQPIGWPMIAGRLGLPLDDKLSECGLWTRRQNEGAPWANPDPTSVWAADYDIPGVRIYGFEEVMEREARAVVDLEPHWVQKGTTHQISAPGGKHKSRFLLQAGLGMAAGRGIFGNRPHEPVAFVYYSYEDGRDEVTRRVQAIAQRLNIERAEFRYVDMQGFPEPTPWLHVNEAGQITVTDFGADQVAFLKAIPGHKFVGLDGLYNAVKFERAGKSLEDPVLAVHDWLEALCGQADATVAYLFHPTYAGQARGDASGFSIAFHNRPRVRIMLATDDDNDDTITLSMPKRNQGPKAKPLTLHWAGGALLPNEASGEEVELKLRAAVIEAAVKAAGSGAPLQKQANPPTWVFQEIERRIGRRPSKKEIKTELDGALRDRQLRYRQGTRHHPAGYYPWEGGPPALQDEGSLAILTPGPEHEGRPPCEGGPAWEPDRP